MMYKWGNLRERDHWGDQDLDGRIILRWIFTMYDVRNFYLQSTRCIYVFHVDLRTNSDYFSIQH